tara:strand:- start:38 stop:424 length:387 start_codon:yes stop_codon:yes gene_type:complete
MASKYVKAGQKVFEFLVPKPKVPKSRLEKAESRYIIAKHKADMAQKKLDQTNFEIENPKFSKGDYTYDSSKKNRLKTSDKKRKELKGGSKKSDFGAQSVKYGLDKNYDVTKADRIAKFVGKKNKKKVI